MSSSLFRFAAWLRRLAHNLSATNRSDSPARRRKQTRPLREKLCLEGLEERMVPSTLTVVSESGSSQYNYSGIEHLNGGPGTPVSDQNTEPFGGGSSFLDPGYADGGAGLVPSPENDGNSYLFGGDGELDILPGLSPGTFTGNASGKGSVELSIDPTSPDETSKTPVFVDVEINTSEVGGGTVTATTSLGGTGIHEAHVGDSITANINFNVDLSGTNPLSGSPPISASASASVSFALVSAPFTPDAGGPYTIQEGQSQPITLDASNTSNPDDLPLTYTWQVNVNGTWQNVGTGQTATIDPTTLQNLGITAAGSPYQVHVEVTDTADNITLTSDPVNLTVKPATATLSVTTPDSEEPSGPTFGPYLPGVNLDVPFTVTANDPNHQIASVKWWIAGGRSGTAKPTGAPGTWTFSQNVGNLTTGDHTLTVTAYNSAGQKVGDPFTGTIHVAPQPISYQLKAAYPGGTPEDVRDLRFIRTDPAVPLTETFTGTLTGVPSYYDNSLQVKLGAKLESATPQDTGGYLTGFTFTEDAGDIHVGTSDVPVRLGGVPLSQVSTQPIQPQQVLAVAEPPWLRTGTVSFDTSDGSYHFDSVQVGTKLSLPMPSIDTGFQWLNNHLQGLKTDGSVTADVDVVIPLDKNKHPTFTANSLQVNAEVLGQSVWDKPYSSSDVIIEGKLDPNTLNPQGLSIKLANPVVLGTQTFLGKTFEVPLIPRDPLLHVAAKLGLSASGSLTGDAGIELDAQGNQLVLNPAGTFLDLEATANGNIRAEVTASILDGWLGTYKGQAFLNATLDISGKAQFSGPLSHPSVASSDLSATLSGNYGYNVSGEQKITDDDINQGDSEQFGPIQLI